MEFLWNKLTEWLKEMLVGGVMSNLTGLFDSINEQVSEIAGTVGTTPQGWNSGVFSMVQSLSNNVVVPIAGVLLAIVMAMELIQMVVDRNNMNDFDVGQIIKWVCKSFFAIILFRVFPITCGDGELPAEIRAEIDEEMNQFRVRLNNLL